ncbi:MAG: xanthine dehydrogenase [Sphingopyxis sp.]|nr:xanthine dehydrogenase [Sphingopyxis sp.]
MIASSPIDILQFAAARSREGLGTVLVTLTDIIGSSPRAIGAQMAVASDGRYLGSLSGGCVEAAIVAEAMKIRAEGRPRLVRYGAGSPYLDIRLPCGGGIDLLFTPDPDERVIAALLSRLEAREAATLRLSSDGAALAPDSAHPHWRDDSFLRPYAPPLRVVAIGQGEELTALASLARSFGAKVESWTPDRRALADLAQWNLRATELTMRSSLPAIASDAWTAILFLFHDRDWEEALLPHALTLPAFYVGAVGSRRTQDSRVEMLRATSVPDASLRRLETMVGLIPATRDPATLALSILSQLAGRYQTLTPAERPVSFAEQ